MDVDGRMGSIRRVLRRWPAFDGVRGKMAAGERRACVSGALESESEGDSWRSAARRVGGGTTMPARKVGWA